METASQDVSDHVRAPSFEYQKIRRETKHLAEQFIAREAELKALPTLRSWDVPLDTASVREVVLPHQQSLDSDRPFIGPGESITLLPFRDAKFGSFGMGRPKSIMSVDYKTRELHLMVKLREGAPMGKERAIVLSWDEVPFWFRGILYILALFL